MAAVELHHVVEGPEGSPVLVLIGSLGTTLAVWEPQIEALADELRVIRVDLRGHGRSPVVPGPYDLADLAADVLAVLDRRNIGRAHVAGLALGAMVATWLAAHAPERIDRMVLCSASARLGPARGWAERAAIVREHGTGAIADGVVSRWLTPAYAADHPAGVRRLRGMVAGMADEGYAAGCGVIERMDLEDDLARIEAPTLVIAGADDPITPPDHGAHVASRIPDARMTVVADAAHLVNVQHPADVAALVLRHVRGQR
jgi:3-oxoadipate enol-lactonase